VLFVKPICTHLTSQGDAEDRKKLRAADKERLRQMDVERDIDQRFMEAEEMATMGLTCALVGCMDDVSCNSKAHALIVIEYPRNKVKVSVHAPGFEFARLQLGAHDCR
jgi:hypothetical protein